MLADSLEYTMSVTTQKISVFIFTAVKISSLVIKNSTKFQLCS